ncbi:MAG: hypothetical protein U0797_01815 [Gemmataceae bacterium]
MNSPLNCCGWRGRQGGVARQAVRRRQESSEDGTEVRRVAALRRADVVVLLGAARPAGR